MSDIEAFRNLEDISFIDSISIEALQQQAIAIYEKEYENITGNALTLYPADPMRIQINTFVLLLYQGYQYLERAGKQNLLRYSYGKYLEHMGALKGVTRLPPQQAKTQVRFTLSAPQQTDVEIPKNTRVSSGDHVYFAVLEKTVIPPGEWTADADCICLEQGTVGNGYEAGQLNVLVDPIAYVQKVENITKSQGGSQAESDTSLSERIFLSPSSYSVAGPKDAYLYWVKTYSTQIQDVYVERIVPGEVGIWILLTGGALPEEAFLKGLEAFLEEEGVRPLTDKVTIKPPTVIHYDIHMTYYISTKNRNKEADIQKAVEKAVDNYMAWQKECIGRDINASELIRCVMEAGAKRVEVTEPVFQPMEHTALAVCEQKEVIYGGLEYD